jgi:hypothetical protein
MSALTEANILLFESVMRYDRLAVELKAAKERSAEISRKITKRRTARAAPTRPGEAVPSFLSADTSARRVLLAALHEVKVAEVCAGRAKDVLYAAEKTSTDLDIKLFEAKMTLARADLTYRHIDIITGPATSSKKQDTRPSMEAGTETSTKRRRT